MNQIRRYFTEFEFQPEGGQENVTFWFPVLINVPSLDEAGLIRTGIAEALEKRFRITKEFRLHAYTGPVRLEALLPYIAANREAEVFKLNLNQLTFGTFDTGMKLVLKEDILIVPQNLLIEFTHTLQYHLDKQHFLTSQFHGKIDYDKDFLVLKIY